MQRILNRLGIVIGFCVVLLLASVLILLINREKVAAQEVSIDMRTRLEYLRDEIALGNLMLGFQFVEPLSSEVDNYWFFGDPDDKSNLAIVEIGNDFFCFSETSHAAVLIRCVPFSNIASFDYLGD